MSTVVVSIVRWSVQGIVTWQVSVSHLGFYNKSSLLIHLTWAQWQSLGTSFEKCKHSCRHVRHRYKVVTYED